MIVSGEHDEGHERRLLDLLLGESQEDAALVEECDECKARQVELAPLVKSMLEQGAQERSRLYDEAQQPDPDADEEATLEAFMATMQERDAQRGRPRLYGWLTAAAAAILVAIFVLMPNDENPEPFYLGSGGLDLGLQPQGEAAEAPEFVWKDVAPAGSYTVEVRKLDFPDGPPLVRFPDLEDAAWKPDPTTLEALKSGIRWEVYVYDALGQLKGSGWAEAQSSP